MLTMWRAIQALFGTLCGFRQRGKPCAGGLLSHRPEGSSRARITIVVLVVNDQDRRLLAGIGSRNQWNVLFADTCEEARVAVDKLRAPVILVDRNLPGREWTDVMKILAASPHRCCIVLASRVVDSYLLNEVVSRGGFDVLSEPLREEDVVRAVKLAWSYWNSPMRSALFPVKGGKS